MAHTAYLEKAIVCVVRRAGGTAVDLDVRNALSADCSLPYVDDDDYFEAVDYLRYITPSLLCRPECGVVQLNVEPVELAVVQFLASAGGRALFSQISEYLREIMSIEFTDEDALAVCNNLEHAGHIDLDPGLAPMGYKLM